MVDGEGWTRHTVSRLLSPVFQTTSPRRAVGLSGGGLAVASVLLVTPKPEEAYVANLLWLIVVVLVVLWLLGFAFKIGGGIIHLLLVIAVIVVIYRLATGRKVV